MVVSNAQKPKSKPNKFMPSFSWDAVNIYFLYLLEEHDKLKL